MDSMSSLEIIGADWKRMPHRKLFVKVPNKGGENKNV
jgi:hypothetical protein